jgi:uncharacterized membrane protein YeiH
MLTLPVYLELAAVVTGALSGALHGLRKGADAFGVLALSVATGVGGGMIRDVLVGQGPPVALRDSRYLAVVVGAGVAASLLGSLFARFGRLMNTVDAVLLGLWVVMGLERALAAGLPADSAVFLGVVTAVGGGMVRDVLSGDRPSATSPSVLYESAALAAALVYVGLVVGAGLPPWIGQLATVATACTLRLLALAHGWMAPRPIDLLSWWRRTRNHPAP